VQYIDGPKAYLKSHATTKKVVDNIFVGC